MIEAQIQIAARPHAPQISRYIYSSFAEHLGRCIYDGIWVDPDSSIPNDAGLRLDTLEALAEIAPPAVRWPGGNWAEYYHWRDGIGSPETRPQRYNIEWGIPESNAFGTHEYMRFCDAIGAEPYLVLNVASGTVQEAREWVEYCNSDHDGSIVRLRKANGQDVPWGVRFWDVGNESWHSGGQCRAQDYVAAYRRYSNKLRMIGTGDRDKPSAITLIACGSCLLYPGWDAAFLAGMGQTPNMLRMVDCVSDHVYQGRDLTDRGFADEDHYRLLAELDVLDAELQRLTSLTKAYSTTRHPIRAVLGEWGVWYKDVWITNQFHQTNTLRDALLTGAAFHLFHSFAPTLYMTNMSMTVNALQCLLQTYGPIAVRTPTYHVYRMYKPHRDGVRLDCEVEDVPYLRPSFGHQRPILSVSASHGDDRLFVSVVNLDLFESVRARMSLPVSFRLQTVEGERLTSRAVQDANTEQDPDTVHPVSLPVEWDGAHLEVAFPPKSVTTLLMRGTWLFPAAYLPGEVKSITLSEADSGSM